MDDPIRAPVLLVAMPQVQDPFFRRSVVLLVAHETDGSLGFVLNRRTDLQVEQILSDLEIPWGGALDEPAFLGGPVEPQVGSVLFPSTEVAEEVREAAAPVTAGVCLTRNLTVFSQLAAEPPSRLRVLLGHAGWAPGQLFDEIERHDWLTAPVDASLIFGPADKSWERAVRSLGIDPSTLPEWSDQSVEAN